MTLKKYTIRRIVIDDPTEPRRESTDYLFDRELIKTVLEKSNHNALLYGPRGTGKTTEGQHAKKGKQNVYSVTLTAEQSQASVIGHFKPEGNKFVWHDGPAVLAWRGGDLLIINEIDHASEDVSNALHAILDDPEVAQLTLPSNETVKPKTGFRVIATMNGSPEELHPAVLDRFAIKLPVFQPSSAQLSLLDTPIKIACVNAYKIAASKKNGEPDITYRMFKAFNDLRKPLGVKVAAEAIVTDKALANTLIEAVRVNGTV